MPRADQTTADQTTAAHADAATAHNAAATHGDATTVDVVIVGAGFAGLSAAERLTGMGLSVMVVEGRDRVGGRSFTGHVAGVEVDLGATWVARRHTAIRDLASRLGCTTTRQFDDGRNVLWLGGRRRTYQGTIPRVSPVTLLDVTRTVTALEKLMRTVDVDGAWWESPQARRLDTVSFGEWLDRRHALASTRALMAIVSKVQWGCSPGDVSLLHVLRYIRAAGGLNHMLDVEDGANEERITETTQEIARRLAQRLGDGVVLDAPVRRIVQDDGVTVHTDSLVVHAAHAIVTAAPEHRAGIAFEPALPDTAEGLAGTWRMGALSKAFVAYETPFWRTRGLSGEALTDTGAVFITFDVSPGDGGPGVLMAFCDPRVFDGFGLEERRSRVIDQLVDLYGPEAGSPIDYIDHRWGAEPFAPGGPHPAAPPHASVAYARALTEPHGRIHWAGTETAGEWAGTMNGAVLSGQRAAEEVARRLGRGRGSSS